MIYSSSTGAGRPQVVICSRLACQLGVLPGMSLAEAQALLHSTRLAAHQIPSNQPAAFELAHPEIDRESLRALAQKCTRFSPYFGIEQSDHPECLFLDATGCSHLFGDESGLAEAVVHDFRNRGFQVRVGLAPTLGAAWAVAHYGELSSEPWQVINSSSLTERLSPMPVEALRLPVAMTTLLRELGVRTLAQVRTLPRASLPSRFGPLLLRRLNQAWGDEPEVLETESPADPLIVTWAGEFPLVDRQCFRMVCGELLDQLLSRLRPRREGIRALRCQIRDTRGCLEELHVRFVAPVDQRRHLFDIFCLNWERVRLPDEIIWVQLDVTHADAMAVYQRDLFGLVGNEDHHKNVTILLDRLSSRLGPEAVVRPHVCQEAQPELAVTHEPCFLVPGQARCTSSEVKRPKVSGSKAEQVSTTWPLIPLSNSNSDRNPGHRSGVRPADGCFHASGVDSDGQPRTVGRPTRLFSPPQTIEVSHAGPEGAPFSFWWNRCEQRVIRSWGPERIETGWWRELPIRRNYFRVEVQTGHQFWLFHDLLDFTWFVHGTFD